LKQHSPILENYLFESKKFKPPVSAQNNAKKAIAWREKYPNEVKGGTKVGWTRARQLANGDELSLDIVKRMYSFFSRHDGNEDVPDKYKNTPWRDNGLVSFNLWGGQSGYTWAKNILKDLGEIK
jgi:hypothetical protein